MPRRRDRKKRSAGRVEELLDRVKGDAGDRDHRPDRRSRRSDRRADADAGLRAGSRWPGFRTLEIERNRELFAELVTLDYDYLLSQDFAAGPRVLADLLPQSVLGRAQNGHGWFTDGFGLSLRFPDATFDRVLTVLEGADPNLKGPLVRGRRGALLNRFAEWLLRNIDSTELVLDVDGAPPFGIDFLGGVRVSTREFLTGLVLAGFMDDWQTRRTAMFEHRRTFTGQPFQIGGGDILLVDRERFELCGLRDAGDRVLDDDELRTLKDIGVLCMQRDRSYSFPDHDQVFFRRRLGDGICDDLAMIWVGARFGYDAMVGAFLMDAIDTYDKYVLDLTWGGFDTGLARRIQEHFLERGDGPLVDDRHLFDLIHFAAKRNEPWINLSSSHRRFIQVEPGADVPTLLNHWRFLQGEPVHEIKLGYSRIEAGIFYGVARERLAAIGESVPEPRFLKPEGRRRRHDRDR